MLLNFYSVKHLKLLFASLKIDEAFESKKSFVQT